MIDVRLNAISEIAVRAGQLAMSRFRGAFDQWEKSPGNPVSEVDLAIDRFLHDELRALDPEAGWLSEETVDNADRLACERVWVVDPIDGTRDFVRGRPGWCISVALAERGQIVAGVLDAPVRGEHWTALLGKGAWCNGNALTASTAQSLSGARLPADALPRTETELVAVAMPNSIALRMAMVASDEADLAVGMRRSHEWDLAAAGLIAAEAGATVTDAFGAPIRYNTDKAEVFGVLATSPGIHAAMLGRLRKHVEAELRR